MVAATRSGATLDGSQGVGADGRAGLELHGQLPVHRNQPAAFLVSFWREQE
uniref:Uncharacterized protein n=1 Tax=Arundo donax TaxID=35708 RepID=A0A0A8YMC2_ARUDO